jgi:rhodanese-related sulfurtransferase
LQADPRRLPGAREAELETLPYALRDVPTEREIVFYCACPNDASAAHATRLMLKHGHKRVRPLAGGLDGWFAQSGEAGAVF